MVYGLTFLLGVMGNILIILAVMRRKEGAPAVIHRDTQLDRVRIER